jgi:hypothetical protein
VELKKETRLLAEGYENLKEWRFVKWGAILEKVMKKTLVFNEV